MLIIKNLYININDKKVIKGIDLKIKRGEIHFLMGPNGAGKTSLAMGLMGNSKFKIQNSKFKVDGKDMLQLKPEERAKNGLFVSFQNPVEIQNVSILAFLRTAYKALYPDNKTSLSEFKEIIKKALKTVNLNESFLQRSINEGFSGGEKKRLEIMQFLILKPKILVLDEIDSGLDIDNLRLIAKIIKTMAQKDRIGILLITHHQNIFRYLKPDFVHVLIDGRIKITGGLEILEKIGENGYAAI